MEARRSFSAVVEGLKLFAERWMMMMMVVVLWLMEFLRHGSDYGDGSDGRMIVSDYDELEQA